jgi:hypothetical protein
MSQLSEVLSFMRPNDQFVCYGENLADTIWHNGAMPVTAEELAAGKTAYEKAKKEADKAKAAEKTALLAKLGLTADELAALLS